MGRSSLQTDSVMQSRSFSLPRFNRRSSAGERQEVARSAEEMAKSAEEAARVQKAAAWQWYTRGVGEAVVPTKAPPAGKSSPSPAPIDDKSALHDGQSKGGADAINVLQKKPLKPPALASRFKAETRSAELPSSAGARQPTPSAPSAHAPSTPLYDEFELSGLRTQMADFVQRLQLQNERSPAPQKPLQHVAVDGHPLPAAPASVSADHQPPAISNDHQLTMPPPSAAPLSSTILLRPFSALHRLFRKVVSGSILKSTKNSPEPAVHEPEVLPEDNPQYHFHHYIHHHHHHYHYGESPEESGATIIPSRRRHSESSSIRPHIPSLLEAESDEEEEEDEKSPIEAYLSRRRRYSDSFAGHLPPKKAAFDEEKEEFAKAASPLQPQRRYNSERFSPNKIPMMVIKELAQRATDEGFPDVRSRRRHSAEYHREGASLERKAEGGGKSGGGTYKLGGGATDGATAAIKPLVRRRHSEGLQRPEGVHTPSPGRAYWRSPSARYVEDGASFPANTAPAAARRPLLVHYK